MPVFSSLAIQGAWALLAALAQDPEPPIGPPLPPPASQAPEPAEAKPESPARELPSYEPRYRGSDEAALFLDALALGAPERARRFDVARTLEGRAVAALEIFGPGPTPVAQRPTILLIGGLDGRSLAGSEAVLDAAASLVEGAEALGSELAVIAIPFASPEALDRCASGGRCDGLDSRPVDEDRDGAEGEDAPDDLDGDGVVLRMLVEDPAGPWARSGDPRFLVPARPSDPVRYVLAAEGRDDDRDGRFNEDPPGGVQLDRNFPRVRDGSPRDPHEGVLPLSEPVSRALADLALSRRIFACVLFQANHGSLALPGATRELDQWSEADRSLYLEQARAFARASSRPFVEPCTLLHARGSPTPGAALDWFATVVGALSVEVAPWGPEVEAGPDSTVRDARYRGQEFSGDPASAPCAPDRAWAAWIDNSRGGLGFVEWHPIELEGGRRALVGGFEPFTVDNPPAQSLGHALEGAEEYVRELATSAPRLEIQAAGSRDGSLVTVRAVVRNLGRLPSGLTAKSAVRRTQGVRVTVDLPEGARLLAGSPTQELAPLAGGETSRELRWLVHAAEGALIGVRADAPWCAIASAEVER
jgi:hypothetical protein